MEHYSHLMQNQWVKKSIALVGGHGYLDKLLRIYPVNLSIRNISKKEQEKIAVAFNAHDYKKLILQLLKFPKFPIDDPYVGFFRKDRTALERNPETVRRLGRALSDLGLQGIEIGLSKPAAPSRKMGPYFQKWSHELGYPILPEGKFLKVKKTAILAGGDAALENFAREYLGYRRKKGLDLVMKKNGKYIIAEAKFITTSGGTQDKSFREGIDFLKKKSKHATHIVIFDGVIWAVSGRGLYASLTKLTSSQTALSALLLPDFIKHF